MNDTEKKKLFVALGQSFIKTIPPSKHNKIPYVIIVDGKRVAMGSKKQLWNGPGAAKNALRCHLDGQFFYGHYSKLGSKEIKEVQDEFISKHVEVIPFTDYMKRCTKYILENDNQIREVIELAE